MLNTQTMPMMKPDPLHMNQEAKRRPPSPAPGQDTVQVKYRRLAKGTKELTSIYNLGLTLGTSLNQQEIIQACYQKSRQLLHTTNLALALYNPHLEQLDFQGVFLQGQAIPAFSVKLTKQPGITAQVLTAQHPVLVPDILQTDYQVEISHLCLEHPVRSWLGVPIRNPVTPDSPVQGVMAVWSDQPDAFTAHHQHLLSALAAQADIALRNLHLFQTSQRQALEVAVINELAQTLMATLDLPTVLRQMMAQLEGLFQLEAGALFLVDYTQQTLVLKATLDQAQRVQPQQHPIWYGLAGQAALTGKPVSLTAPVPEAADLIAQHCPMQVRNCLCLPLLLHGQVIGVLELINKPNGPFTVADQQLLSSLAVYAAIAIDNARLHTEALADKKRVIEAHNQARQKLARDLHDGPTQQVSAMLMGLDVCRQALTRYPSRVPEELARLQQLGDQAIHQMRTLLSGLRSLILEADGLEAALSSWLERRQVEVRNTKLQLTIKPRQPSQTLERQASAIEEAVFAIVQEGVNNALKHAQATEIGVRVTETTGTLKVLIADNGGGFDLPAVTSTYANRGSLGLLNLRERAEAIGGTLKVVTSPGQGTQLYLRIPIHQPS